MPALVAGIHVFNSRAAGAGRWQRIKLADANALLHDPPPRSFLISTFNPGET
jgi:hypothetical protein